MSFPYNSAKFDGKNIDCTLIDYESLYPWTILAI